MMFRFKTSFVPCLLLQVHGFVEVIIFNNLLPSSFLLLLKDFNNLLIFSFCVFMHHEIGFCILHLSVFFSCFLQCLIFCLIIIMFLL